MDPKTDKRIDFVGGIRGLGELERRVHTDMKVAFSMYPTSIAELFAVADAGETDASKVHMVRAKAAKRAVPA